MTSSTPSHVFRVAETPSPEPVNQQQVMSPKGVPSWNLPAAPYFPARVRSVQMSKLVLPPEWLQQMAALASRGHDTMRFDEEADTLRACRKNREACPRITRVTCTQSLNDRVMILEQRLTESNQREHALVKRLRSLERSQDDRFKGLEGPWRQCSRPRWQRRSRCMSIMAPLAIGGEWWGCDQPELPAVQPPGLPVETHLMMEKTIRRNAFARLSKMSQNLTSTLESPGKEPFNLLYGGQSYVP